MTKKELLELVKLGEGLNIEFKKNFSASVGKEICAFANTIGGKILFGVDDKGNVTGLTNFNRVKSQVQDIARNMDPPISIGFDIVDKILIAIVPKGSKKPYSVNGKFYTREAANSQQLKRDKIREFFYKEHLVYFDEKLCQEFDIKKDFSELAFERFLERSEIHTKLDRKDLLENMRLTREKVFSNAAVLLFSKDITRHFISATITCVLFMGKTKYRILDKKVFKGDLYSNYQDAIRYFLSHLNTEYIIKSGPREEKLELPEDALREAVLNAIAHRDYRSTTNIQIYIFNDRVEIVNPGGLVGGLKMEDLGKRSMPRNPLLFSMMERMDLVEQVGSGILRMQDGMKEYGLKEPVIEADENWFSITFKRKILDHKQADEPVREVVKLTQLQQKVLECLKEDPHVTYDELTNKFKKSRDTIRLTIKKLKTLNLVERVGSDKKGHWQIKTTERNEKK
ncbi:MAG: helix-turn-helix domain-containing protein [Candidatus Aminicenantes bacterium]|jgi:ATP-dependent DNA helicase RecG